MTNEEAKMQIQAIPEKIWDQLSEPDREAMGMAFSALEKQIPKEPNYKVEDRYIKNHFISIPICPICHREIVAGDMHCYSCGQRISWEE